MCKTFCRLSASPALTYNRKVSPISKRIDTLLWALCILGIGLVNVPDVCAQDGGEHPFHYGFHTTTHATLHGTTPFWHHANTYGRISSQSRANSLTGIRGELPSYTWRGVDIAAGAELTARMSDTDNTAHFTELYGSLQYHGIRLQVGRFKHATGLYDEKLSMGSMLVSRNATPVPKIELATSEYIDVPLSDGNLQFKIYWSEGLLEENRHIEYARLHQKALHFKIPIGTSFDLRAGLTQSTQWGGEDPGGKDLSLQFWEYVGLMLHYNGGRWENTLASYDIATKIARQDWSFIAYREIFMEDVFFLRSPWDGLWGLSVNSKKESKKWVNKLTYEFVNTIQQDALAGLPKGRARYYTHHTYRSGWTYHGNVIGNPLIRNPQYRASGDARDDEPNLMIIAHHLGMAGRPTPRFSYKAHFTYSRNYGICQNQIISGSGGCRIKSSDTVPPDLETIPRSELRQDQYATLLDARYLLSEAYGLRLRSSVAVDWGEFDGTQIGFILGLQWDGTISL